MTETPSDPTEDYETSEADVAKIRELNDHLRKRLDGGRVLMTQGVDALADATIARVIAAIQQFDAFTPDNDPYGTHEFGMMDVAGERVMFKIDAYDANLEYGSPNPADPEVTRRVMTILLASEY